MMGRRDVERGHVVPTIYGPELHRYEFWKPHATPIPASLLNLTGWLGQNPSRLLAVEKPDGPVSVRASEIRPEDSVLFRLDRPGSRERADWEAYFGWVTVLQAHEWTVQQLRDQAQARIAPILERIADLARQRKEAEQEAAADQARYDADLAALRVILARRAADRGQAVVTVDVPAGAFGLAAAGTIRVIDNAAERGVAPSDTVDPVGQRLAAAVRARGEAMRDRWDSVWRDFDRRLQRLEAERKPYDLEIARLDQESSRRVYTGLFARINAFLHVQALSAATIAIEEYRTNPRRESALAEERERRLAGE